MSVQDGGNTSMERTLTVEAFLQGTPGRLLIDARRYREDKPEKVLLESDGRFVRPIRACLVRAYLLDMQRCNLRLSLEIIRSDEFVLSDPNSKLFPEEINLLESFWSVVRRGLGNVQGLEKRPITKPATVKSRLDIRAKVVAPKSQVAMRPGQGIEPTPQIRQVLPIDDPEPKIKNSREHHRWERRQAKRLTGKKPPKPKKQKRLKE